MKNRWQAIQTQPRSSSILTRKIYCLYQLLWLIHGRYFPITKYYINDDRFSMWQRYNAIDINYSCDNAWLSWAIFPNSTHAVFHSMHRPFTYYISCNFSICNCTSCIESYIFINRHKANVYIGSSSNDNAIKAMSRDRCHYLPHSLLLHIIRFIFRVYFPLFSIEWNMLWITYILRPSCVWYHV